MNGEGFAYFRWHCLKWPEMEWCVGGPQAWCTDIWRDMQRQCS